MQNLLTFAYQTLKKTGYKVFGKKPPLETNYPFIEYEVNQSMRAVSPNIYMLTVTVWDRSNSTQRVETVTDEADAVLEGVSYQDECVQVKVKRQSRMTIPDEDKEIQRRELIYELRVFEIC